MQPPDSNASAFRRVLFGIGYPLRVGRVPEATVGAFFGFFAWFGMGVPMLSENSIGAQ
jgi:hypothetical protein